MEDKEPTDGPFLDKVNRVFTYVSYVILGAGLVVLALGTFVALKKFWVVAFG